MALATGYGWVMKPDTPVSASAATDPVEIVPAVEGDLPGIVEILNYTAANSIANFFTRPVSVAERRGWFRQFSSTGCYRRFVPGAEAWSWAMQAASATGSSRLSRKP